VREVQELLKGKQDEIREQNRQIDEGVFAAVNDPRRPVQPPKREEIPPAINLAPLENGAAALTKAADRYRRAVADTRSKLNGSPDTVKAVNARLIQAEGQLIDPTGLPRRPWYRHLLYAPGFYTGYAVKTMPGAREAIEQKAWAEAEREAARIAVALEREARLVDAAAADLERVR
jgi:N-acetylated-alpha-linked acidic dipeptidase